MSRPDAESGAGKSHGAVGAAASIPALAWSLARQWFVQLVALTAACAVVAATIAGALGVGDALQGGLRALALERLGGIAATVVADDFVRADLAREVARAGGPAVVPAIVLEVALDAPASTGRDARSARATLLACDQAAALGFDPQAPAVGRDEVAINEVLARNLGVSTGETIVLRIAKRSEVPADSPLGRRTMESLGRRLRVVAVLPPRGIGRFSLRPAQVTGGMGLVSLSTAQEVLRRGDVANAAFAVGDVDPEAIRQALHPTLEDYGLKLEEMAGGALRLSSRRLLLPAEVDRAATEVLGPLGGKRTLAFLVNEIGVPAAAGLPAASIPYSTVLGVDTPSLPVGSLLDASGGELSIPDDDGIVIDQWMADDFAAQGHPVAPGDVVDVRLFRSETLHGRVEEMTHRLRITGVARMEGAAVARSLVPEVEGITDEKSIADWDPPFPFDRSKVRTVPPHDEDDRYWKAHGATPKAFVSLGCGERLAGSRFGATTAWFVPPTSRRAEVAAELAGNIVPEKLGLRVEASRRDALAAAKGSTPFGGLFLALSSFVVAAGLLLEWLLFSLLVAARRRDIGVLAAIGWPAVRITGLLVLVGALAAAVGGIVGTASGPAWARLLLGALSSSWNASVAAGSSSAFGDGVIRWTSLVVGAVAGFLLSMAAIVSAARRAAGQKPLTLLRGGGDAAADRPWAGRRALVVALLALVGALAVTALAGRLEAQAAVGMFFLSGVLALVGLLSLVRLLLTRGPGGRAGLKSLVGLAWRGLAHRPSRAFSIAAIVAVAEFLIVAVSAFSLSSPPRPRERSGPTGGWTSIATFAAPTAVNPADTDVSADLGLSDDARQTLAGATLEPIRASAGDDASCTNLYAPARPIVLGVGPRFVARGGFRFTGHAPLTSASSADTNPWQLLGRTGDGPIPAILDDATARWALKLGGVGARFTLPDDEGTLVEFEIVGLLEPGILQGWVIVAESDFQAVFPSRSGAAMALIDAGEEPPAAVDRAASAAWVDAGVTIQPTLERLRSLSAVQNTFLAAFQALGTLGLLLGTAGVAAAQIQGVLERIGTFGLLGAVGFPPARLRAIVLLETCFMVGLGLAAGALAGAVTLPAHIAGGRAVVPLAWIALTCGLTLLVALLAGLVATRSVARLKPRDALAARG